MNRLFLFVLAISTVVLMSVAAYAGELVVYTALEDDEIAVYLPDFEAKYPNIDVKLVRDSTGIITAKLLAEKDKPQADVVWGTAATSLLICDQHGMLAGYSPKGIDKVKDQFKDRRHEQAHWVGIKAWVTGFVGNTIEMDKYGLEMPQSYADLLDPQYKGYLVMPNPNSSGTGYLTVSAIMQLMGEEAGWAYLDALHENIIRYTHSGSAPAKLAGAGEHPVGISFAYRGYKQKASGQPVEVAFPAEGSGWDMEANALMKKPRIKNDAKLFLDWAISDAAMKLYAEVYPIIAVSHIAVDAPAGWPADPMSQLIDNDFDWAAANRERILKEWTKRYDGKSDPK